MNSKTLALFYFLSFANAATAQTVTVPEATTIDAWGPGGSVAYGETLTVPNGANSLQSFTFADLSTVSSPSFTYKTYIYAFNPGTAIATGPALYTSSVQTVPASGSVSDTITPANVPLTPGGVYMVFVSSAGLSQTSVNAIGQMGVSNFGHQVYPGGKFYYTDDLLGFDADSWSDVVGNNAAFTAVFGQMVFTTSFAATPGLTPNQHSVAANVDFNSATPSPQLNAVITALQNLPANALPGSLNELTPVAFGQFTSTTAFNNASFETESKDNYLALQRTGPNGTFVGGNGTIDASGLTLNDPSYDPGLAMVHSRLLAWNPAPFGAISDSASSALGGIAMRDPKEMAAKVPAYDNPWNFYVRGNVVLAQGFSQPDVSHFDSNTASVQLGTDYRINPNFLVGLTAGYGHSDATLDNNGSSATIDSYSPGLYASYADGGYYANFSGSYTHDAYTQSRVIGFLGQTANSAPEGNEGTANLDGGYDFHLGHWTVGPLAGLQYTHLTVDGYQEGGSDADLTVNEQQSDSLRSRLGGRVSFTYSHCGINFTPHLDASWQHEFLDQSRGITSQFTGSVGSFSVQTTDPSRDSALVDVGLNAEINQTVTVFADYMVQAGQENYFGQSVQAGVKIGF